MHPSDRPVWDAATFAIAEAVRKGEPVARVPMPPLAAYLKTEDPYVSEWLDRIQNDISVIKIEYEEPEVEKRADDHLQKEGQRLLDMGRRMLHKKAGGETLHAALTVYNKWIESKFLGADKRLTAWG